MLEYICKFLQFCSKYGRMKIFLSVVLSILEYIYKFLVSSISNIGEYNKISISLFSLKGNPAYIIAVSSMETN